MQLQTLSQAEISSITDGISSVFAMSNSMKYIPLASRTPELNRYGESTFTYNEYAAFPVYGCLELQQNLTPDLDRNDTKSSKRVEAILKLVVRDVVLSGYEVVMGDAVDIINEYGNWIRWVIFGEQSRVELPGIIARYSIVRADTLSCG
jgi:hypothetical protein